MPIAVKEKHLLMVDYFNDSVLRKVTRDWIKVNNEECVP